MKMRISTNHITMGVLWHFTDSEELLETNRGGYMREWAQCAELILWVVWWNSCCGCAQDSQILIRR